MTSATAADSKLNNDMMRMTHPSSSDSAAQLNMPEQKDQGYKSATDFGKQGGSALRTGMARSASKGIMSGKRGPSIGQKGSGGSTRPLPSIDHSKQMSKLRSITGRSEDFGATTTSNDSVQFSKPKIGVKMRGSNSMTAPGGMKGRVNSKQDLTAN
mmetsp:Transcript_47912/g.63409  ORF Transcript_47912/g.63409 Transcript_47912/m.63409 type:complete len:156 (+) Transcript_47912:221-688(+)